MPDESTPPAAAVPTPPTRIPKEAMYRVANIGLRLENLALQQELLKRDQQIAQRDLTEASDEIAKMYGLNPQTHRVLPDGQIVPLDSPLLQRQGPRA